MEHNWKHKKCVLVLLKPAFTLCKSQSVSRGKALLLHIPPVEVVPFHHPFNSYAFCSSSEDPVLFYPLKCIALFMKKSWTECKFGATQTCIWFPALWLWGSYLTSPSKPKILHVSNLKNNSCYFIGLLWEIYC